MNKRKMKNKLLTYYLNLADFGDQYAAEKAKEIAKELFKESDQDKHVTSKNIKASRPNALSKGEDK